MSMLILIKRRKLINALVRRTARMLIITTGMNPAPGITHISNKPPNAPPAMIATLYSPNRTPKASGRRSGGKASVTRETHIGITAAVVIEPIRSVRMKTKPARQPGSACARTGHRMYLLPPEHGKHQEAERDVDGSVRFGMAQLVLNFGCR
jgi:hypothetical protein